MTKLIMLSGIPGSGKSTTAKEVAQKENAVILSSDEIYVELTGDTEHKESNGSFVFQELYKRAREHLKNKKSVIIDSTNISSKRRKGMLQQFKIEEKECYYIATPFSTCVEQDKKRERNVGYGRIKEMYKSYIVPFESDGFTKVHYVVNDDYKNELSDLSKEDFENALKAENHFLLYEKLKNIKYFSDIYNISHDSKYHTFSISRHIFYVLDYINKNYKGEDLLLMQYVALFHDVGKGPAKSFKDESKYANFIGHENVSAQIAFGLLTALGYEESFVKKVTKLVALHMRLPREGSSEKAFEKFKNLVDTETYEKLVIFREADDQAK